MPSITDPIEARVVARLDQEKSELEARITAAVDQRASALTDVTQSRESSQREQDRLYNLIDGDKAIGGNVEALTLAAMSLHRKMVAVYATAHKTVLDLRAQRKTLDTKAEKTRRVKQARDYDPATDEPLTQRQAVELVLLRAGRPMHYQDITRVALETGLLRTDGATPEATVSAMLATRAKAGDTFVKVEPGIFNLLPVESAEVAS